MNGKSTSWLKFLKINPAGQLKSACGPEEAQGPWSGFSGLDRPPDILPGWGTVRLTTQGRRGRLAGLNPLRLLLGHELLWLWPAESLAWSLLSSSVPRRPGPALRV